MENIPSKVLFHSYRMVISSIPISKRVNYMYALLSYDAVSGSEIKRGSSVVRHLPLVLEVRGSISACGEENFGVRTRFL